MSSFVNLLEIIYPVGSFYLSANNESPANIVGGTWVQIENAVIRASTSVGYVGSDTHTMTTNEMPSHYHKASNYASLTGWNGDSPGFFLSRDRQGGSTTDGPSTGYSGGGAAMSLVQRSYNCFVWQRVS